MIMEMNKLDTKRMRTTTIALLLASIILLATASLYAYYQFEMIGKIKAELEDPLEAWSEASYITWQYNSTFYATRNMSTLLGEYFGTDDDAAIQWGIDKSTTFGGTVYVKAPSYTGTYNAAVTLKNKVTLILESGATGISVTIDSGATATLLDYHNYDFKHWENGLLTTFIEDESQNEDYSYLVFAKNVSGTMWYFAKNGTDGSIPFVGTDASQIINNAITILLANDGGTILFKVGLYTFDASILIPAAATTYAKTLKLLGESFFTDVLATKTMPANLPQGVVFQSADGFTGTILNVGYDAASGVLTKGVEVGNIIFSGHALPYLDIYASSITMTSGNAGLKATNIINGYFHHLGFINCYYGLWLTTNGGTNDGVILDHLWAGYNRYGIYLDGADQFVEVSNIYTYLNYGTGFHAAGMGIDLDSISSNADDWDDNVTKTAAIEIASSGFVRGRNIFIENGKDGALSGQRGMTLYITSDYNATISLTQVVIQSVGGNGIVVYDTNKAGFIDLTQVFCSPSSYAYLGGDGSIGNYGIESLIQHTDGTQLRIYNSVFKYAGWMGMHGNFTVVTNTWNNTEFIESYYYP